MFFLIRMYDRSFTSTCIVSYACVSYHIYSLEMDALISLFCFCYFRHTMLYTQEFVQSEIDREAAAIADDRERARKAEDRSAGVDDRLKKLREQVSTLQEGVSQVSARRRDT